MTVEVFRESTDAELDAKMLAELREHIARRAPYGVGLTGDEAELVLRIADERDALRHEACADPDPRYVIRECASCHHEPHGYLLPCNRQTCGCRDGRPKP